MKQFFVEVVACPLIEDKHTLTFALRATFLWGQFALFNLNTIFLSQETQSIVIPQLFLLHDEMHHITTLSASETFTNSSRGRYRKRRCSVIMERAESTITGTCTPQSNIFRHNIYNVGCTAYPLYGDWRNHILSLELRAVELRAVELRTKSCRAED